MYEAVVVASWIVGEKTPAGLVPTYNSKERLVKIITGMSEEECCRKTEQFLSETQFINLKQTGVQK